MILHVQQYNITVLSLSPANRLGKTGGVLLLLLSLLSFLNLLLAVARSGEGVCWIMGSLSQPHVHDHEFNNQK